MAFDRTKWYSIDLEKLDSLIGPGDPMDEMTESKQTDETVKPAASLKRQNTQQNAVSEREAFEQSLGIEKVPEAIELARSKGITTWAYIRAILRNWKKDSHKPKK
ncbi:DnaD domain protein [Domibacillus aminovorans]|nr:DnaD domain protein [Domibacillus aminovorans]